MSRFQNFAADAARHVFKIMSRFQNFAADAAFCGVSRKKKPRSAQFFETALRAVLMN